MESTSKDGAVVNVDSEFVDYSRPLSAVLAEELSASANRSSNEVVRAIEEVLPEFEALKDCILKLLKENEKVKIIHDENKDLRSKEFSLKEENRKLLSMISSLGDQKKHLLSDKAEIEKLQKELTIATEQRIDLQQRLEEGLHEIAELQKKCEADLHEAEKIQLIEYDAKIRMKQEEHEEKLRQQKAGFDMSISEMQQKYAEDLAHEQRSASEKFASLTQQHNIQIAAAEAAFRQQIFEAQQKLVQAEARVHQLEKDNSQLSSTIEILRNDATRFQEARRGVGVSNQGQAILQHSSCSAPPLNSANPRLGVRNAGGEREAPSLRTTAAEAAVNRRRVFPVDGGDDNSESDLDDAKPSKASKRKKVVPDPSTTSTVRKRPAAPGNAKRCPNPLDFVDPYGYV